MTLLQKWKKNFFKLLGVERLVSMSMSELMSVKAAGVGYNHVYTCLAYDWNILRHTYPAQQFALDAELK